MDPEFGLIHEGLGGLETVEFDLALVLAVAMALVAVGLQDGKDVLFKLRKMTRHRTRHSRPNGQDQREGGPVKIRWKEMGHRSKWSASESMRSTRETEVDHESAT